jgi:hypothetical protein
MAGNDDLDQWLDEKITPLPPPDGTFDLIKRRARGRKLRKLAVTVSAAAAVVAAAVVIPRVTLLQVSGPGDHGIAAGDTSHPNGNASGQPDGTGTKAASAAASPSAGGGALPAVPANFEPSSVTYIGVNTGWVIGQAGTPGDCATQYCTSIAGTDNGGQTWYGVPAPVTGAASGSTGVSQIRFLNDEDGWAFGPQLWATHNGGKTWTQISTNGQRVIDLETAGTSAFAILGTCTGSGSNYASDCTSYTLERTQATSDDWTDVGSATTNMAASTASAVQLALTGTEGYLLGPGGIVLSGSLTGTWQQVGTAPCAPATQLFGAENSSTLVIACPSQNEVYESTNSGTNWHVAASYTTSATVTSIAISPAGALVLATTDGIDVYNGTGWQQATFSSTAPDGGFSYVGMTTDDQGVALPADTSLHEIWMTSDGGATWRAYPVAS